MSNVTLREITESNLDAVLALKVAPTQPYVGTVAGALRDADASPHAKPWYRAVYADDEPVGFIMLSWNVSPEPPRIMRAVVSVEAARRRTTPRTRLRSRGRPARR